MTGIKVVGLSLTEQEVEYIKRLRADVDQLRIAVGELSKKLDYVEKMQIRVRDLLPVGCLTAKQYDTYSKLIRLGPRFRLTVHKLLGLSKWSLKRRVEGFCRAGVVVRERRGYYAFATSASKAIEREVVPPQSGLKPAHKYNLSREKGVPNVPPGPNDHKKAMK